MIEPMLAKQQQEKQSIKEMGCGAVICGNTSNPQQLSSLSLGILRNLLHLLTPNNNLLPDPKFTQLSRQIETNISQYILDSKEKIETGDSVSEKVKDKWKLVLYGMDNQMEVYQKCIGYERWVEYYKAKINHNKAQPQSSKHQPQHHPNQLSKDQLQPQSNYQMQLLNHPSFHQIQKDLDRTFELTPSKRYYFGYVLKRISNQFPSMGYTQGINFIVGYLIMIGYNCEDAFWIFVHLTLNRRYMLLGLFEDKFPLSTVYTHLFKGILKRTRRQLFGHLYEQLKLDDSLWIFKWFMTCFLYSFPIQICKYVMDVLVMLGGLGLVYFALGIVYELEKQLVKMNDECQISMFLGELKNLQKFNNFIRINQVIKTTYLTRISLNDLDVLEDQQQNVYAQYIFHYLSLSQISSTILQQWYQQLTNQRDQFIRSEGYNLARGNKIRITIPNNSIKKVLQSKPDPIPIDNPHNNSFINNSQLNNIDQSLPTINKDIHLDNTIKQKNQIKYDKIIAKSVKSKKDNHLMNSEDSLTINLDLRKPKRVSKKPPNYVGINNYLHHDNPLMMAAKSIISVSSLSNASMSNKSESSKNITKRKQKQNGIIIKSKNYNCANKIKTQQQKIGQQQNENGQQIGEKHRVRKKVEVKVGQQYYNKEYIERYSIEIQKKEQENIFQERKRLSTKQQWMINSQGPNFIINNSKNQTIINSDVQIYDGGQLFKKKNKVSNRLGGIIPSNAYNIMDKQHNNDNYVQPQRMNNVNKLQQQQQSCQSIFVANSSERAISRISATCGNQANFEIQSIK